MKFHTHSQLMPALLAPALPYGGQAAIEGVMMKGKTHAALALRRRDGRIEVLDREVKSRFPGLIRLPFIRGFFVLWDMLTLGMWALRESSHRYELDLEAKQREERGEEPLEQSMEETAAGRPTLVQNMILIISLLLALLLFKVGPAAATTGVFGLLGWGPLREVAQVSIGHQFVANLVEGLIKLGIFVAYVWLVGRLAEIKRVFEYHGAEHTVINAYEDEPQNQEPAFVMSHTTAHPRCGTSFIVILILAAVLLFTLLDWALVAWLPGLVVDNLPVWYLRWPLRIVGLIPLAGISYEVIKGAFRFYTNPLLRPWLRFGMLFQVLTTRRPSAEQIEVSLAAFNRARFLTEGIPEPARAAPS